MSTKKLTAFLAGAAISALSVTAAFAATTIGGRCLQSAT